MNLSPISFVAARLAQTTSAPVSSEVSPKQVVAPSGSSLSIRLPTVGQEPRPEVVSLSPHFVETKSSSMEQASRCFSLAHCTNSRALREALAIVHDVAVALDRESGDRLAGFGDAVDDAAGPARLDADDDAGGDVGIAAGADERAEMEFEIFAELQAAIGVRQRQRALDVVGDRFGGGVGKIIERQNHDVIANADAPVFPAVPRKT